MIGSLIKALAGQKPKRRTSTTRRMARAAVKGAKLGAKVAQPKQGGKG